MEDLLYYNLVDVTNYINNIPLNISVNLAVFTFNDSNTANKYLIDKTKDLANNCYFKLVKDTFRGLPRSYVYYVYSMQNIMYITVVMWGNAFTEHEACKVISDNLLLLDIDSLPTIDNSFTCIEPDFSYQGNINGLTISKTYLNVFNHINNKKQLILIFTIENTVIATFICKEQIIHGTPYRVFLPLYTINKNVKEQLMSLREVV